MNSPQRKMSIDIIRYILFETNQKTHCKDFLFLEIKDWGKNVNRKSREIIKFQDIFSKSAIFHIMEKCHIYDTLIIAELSRTLTMPLLAFISGWATNST